MWRLSLPILMLGMAITQSAAGDGMMFAEQLVGRAAPLVHTPAQEVLLATDRENVTVVLRTHFEAGPRALAWLVPVPGEPKNVRAADDSIFKRLSEQTAPRFVTMVRQ